MKLTSKALAVTILVILFGGILLTSAMNWWQTESSKIPAVYTDGDAAGLYNPADIRGSYTFADIEAAFKVPATELAAAFVIETHDPGSFTVKDLEAQYSSAGEQSFEIGTTSVRLFVAFYAGLPYDLSDDTYLPGPAINILLSKAELTADQISYLAAHTLPDEPVTASEQVLAPTEAVSATLDNENARVVKGKTTFQELFDWGVTPETIQMILGSDLPNPLTTAKDFCTEKGLDFETIKTVLQNEVDKTTP